MEKNVFSSITEFDEAEKYWLDKLSGELKEIRLPRDFHSAAPYTSSQYKLTFENQTDITEKLDAVSKNNHLSLYVFLLTVLKILIFKWSLQNDIIVGSPIYTRNPRDYYKFVAFRDFVNPGMTFKELLLKVKETVAGGYKHQCFPPGNALKLLNIESGFSLFRVVLLLENIHQKDFLEDITANGENDIIFSFRKDNGLLKGDVIYNSILFEPETVRGFCRSYEVILTRVLDRIDIRIADIRLNTGEEQARILFEFNKDTESCPVNKTVTQLFEAQAEKTPGKTAIVGTVPVEPDRPAAVPDVYVTYRELNQRANRLARVLRAKNVRKNNIVGLLMENSAEMAVSILGVLKAGAAYLPIDPWGPVERKKYILEDSGAAILLLSGHISAEYKFPPGNIPAVDVDDKIDEDTRLYPGRAFNPVENVDPTDLSYVIYTSGSTGRPKGVLIQHIGIVNYTIWRLKTYNYTEEDVTLQPLSYCFDGFGANFYSSLLSGGKLVMVPDHGKLDYDYINGLIELLGVTNISLVPGIFGMMLDRANAGDIKSLRFVVLAGDRSSAALVKKCREKAPDLLLVNEYGPTETTVTAAGFCGIHESNTAIIGKPISNIHLYILDSSMSPVSVKVIGELYIAGIGVARGYLDNPGLTADKFIDNPWVPGERMYRTGDLARWLPDGRIEFSGRRDYQVKIRGNRIDPEEIVHRLLENKVIKEAAVIPGEPLPSAGESNLPDDYGDRRLCAYIAAERPLTVSELRRFLSGYLPDYMIPTSFIQVERIPVTTNGKIDKKALLSYGATMEIGVEYIAPTSKMEKKIADVWKEALNRDKIGINDNFFDLGGNSAKVLQVISRLKEILAMDIPVMSMFEFPTIGSFLQHLDKENIETLPDEIELVDVIQEENINMLNQTLHILDGDIDD